MMAIVALALAQNTTSSVDIPSDLLTRALLPNVYGYSVEPIWVDAYISTPLMANLMGQVADVTGIPRKPCRHIPTYISTSPGTDHCAAPIRVGGTSSDETYQYTTLSTGNVSSIRSDSRSRQSYKPLAGFCSIAESSQCHHAQRDTPLVCQMGRLLSQGD